MAGKVNVVGRPAEDIHDVVHWGGHPGPTLGPGAGVVPPGDGVVFIFHSFASTESAVMRACVSQSHPSFQEGSPGGNCVNDSVNEAVTSGVQRPTIVSAFSLLLA